MKSWKRNVCHMTKSTKSCLKIIQLSWRFNLRVYGELLTKLMECRKEKTLTSTAKRATWRPNTTTEPQTATRNSSQPKECQQAINYTESWRLDRSGSGIRPGGPFSLDGYAATLKKPIWLV